MAENDELAVKRQQIKTEIQGGKYKSLGRVMIDGVGNLVQKIPFSKTHPPFWYNSLLFTLLTMLVCFLVSIVFGGDAPALSEEEARRIIITGVSGILLAPLIAIIGVVVHSKLLKTLDKEIVEAIERQEDLDDLQNWLKKTFNLKSELAKSLVLAIVFFSTGIYLRELFSGEHLGVGVYIVAIITGFEALTALSVFLASFALLNRLSQYQIKLFAIDPSSSKVIDRLSEMINSIMLVTAVLLTLFSILAFIGNPLAVAVFLLLPWIVIISIFISSHYALAKIIRKSKWQILANIQSQIETLQAKSEIISEESLSHINKLMDYHNRIRATRNSAIDIRSGFSLLQSFLLPVIGLLLANLLNILDIMSRFSLGK
jgi:hypothetical protein